MACDAVAAHFVGEADVFYIAEYLTVLLSYGVDSDFVTGHEGGGVAVVRGTGGGRGAYVRLGQAREIGHCGADGEGDGSVRFSATGIGTGQLAFVGASCHGEQESTKTEGG
ncbi:hypothetical protein ABH007_09025 [Bacteroides thetaiotaomicron]|uniref:hypothetical protein n=1 Tax=Bacteroides thetaiotaomicron TaxID=818 RepID=UPI00232F95D7|nr:hypothetical protein [Bacteroides thetaiotaomicron]MDC2011572.1 hypothetical protein [Bacteroides thetaiotaomicron]MDC2017359.1 hypothetical protein [Bacteroides thetaiotaomicron]MDC2033909.1 hypothetical protein [Bacteroides thetaiotaomicron]MDC2038253.1 hypothetical protein [Bacteroides thetaiotaomicron]MDC2042741.1 hypothetical protein [Bacteroides thetaiotaomicron]